VWNGVYTRWSKDDWRRVQVIRDGTEHNTADKNQAELRY